MSTPDPLTPPQRRERSLLQARELTKQAHTEGVTPLGMDSLRAALDLILDVMTADAGPQTPPPTAAPTRQPDAATGGHSNEWNAGREAYNAGRGQMPHAVGSPEAREWHDGWRWARDRARIQMKNDPAPFASGFVAYMASRDENTNPHEHGNPKQTQWALGWNAAKDRSGQGPDAWAKGKAAAQSGKSHADCPYSDPDYAAIWNAALMLQAIADAPAERFQGKEPIPEGHEQRPENGGAVTPVAPGKAIPDPFGGTYVPPATTPVPPWQAQEQRYEAWKAGLHAGIYGEFISFNPHAPETTEFAAWENGWKAGQAIRERLGFPPTKRKRPAIVLDADEAQAVRSLAHLVTESRQNVGQRMKDAGSIVLRLIDKKTEQAKQRTETETTDTQP